MFSRSMFEITDLVKVVCYSPSLSFSLYKFPFLSHVQIFLCDISFVCRLKSPYSFFFPFLFPIACLLFFMLHVLFLVAIIILLTLYLVAGVYRDNRVCYSPKSFNMGTTIFLPDVPDVPDVCSRCLFQMFSRSLIILLVEGLSFLWHLITSVNRHQITDIW